MNHITVIKIGGTVTTREDTTYEDIVTLQRRGLPLVLVHGGGNRVTEWLTRLGTPTRFVRGERVTDAPTLEVVTAVLGGLVNKEIVGRINALGGRAAGITGADGALLQASVRDDDMGFVGQVENVDITIITALLEAGLTPVVGTLGQRLGAEPPHLLNINGDVVAGEIAAAVGAARLVFMTDVAGILGADGKLCESLTPDAAQALVDGGIAVGGMIPKIRAGLRALAAGVRTRIIDGTAPHALLQEIDGSYRGTTIAPAVKE